MIKIVKSKIPAKINPYTSGWTTLSQKSVSIFVKPYMIPRIAKDKRTVPNKSILPTVGSFVSSIFKKPKITKTIAIGTLIRNK